MPLDGKDLDVVISLITVPKMGNLYRVPYYNRNPNIRPRIIGNLNQYPCRLQGVASGCGSSAYFSQGSGKYIIHRTLHYKLFSTPTVYHAV